MTDAERQQLMQAIASIGDLHAEQVQAQAERRRLNDALDALVLGQGQIRHDIDCLARNVKRYEPYLDGAIKAQRQRSDYMSTATNTLIQWSVVGVCGSIVSGMAWLAWTLYHQAQADTRRGLEVPAQHAPAVTQPHDPPVPEYLQQGPHR